MKSGSQTGVLHFGAAALRFRVAALISLEFGGFKCKLYVASGGLTMGYTVAQAERNKGRREGRGGGRRGGWGVAAADCIGQGQKGQAETHVLTSLNFEATLLLQELVLTIEYVHFRLG